MVTPAEPFPKLLDDVSDLVQEVAPDGTILRVNRAWRETLGYGQDEIGSLNLFDIVHPESIDHCRQRFDRVIHGEPANDVEAKLRAKDGRTVEVLGSCRCQFKGDRPVACFGVFHETLRQRALDELTPVDQELEWRVRHRTAALVKLNQALKTETQRLTLVVAELEQSNTDLENFAFIAAHDLRAPLHTVKGYCHLLADGCQGKLDADADKLIATIVDDAERMGQMLDGLLEYSRVGSHVPKLEPTDSDEVLGMALRMLAADAEESNAVITHDPLPVVLADRNHLLQVFQNLIGNAIKYSGDEPPKIHISARQGENEWRFSVQDHGIGIDPRESDRIFEIFARLHKDAKGTGIGLAICKRIVQRHAGRIWVEPGADKGSVFHFTLSTVLEDDIEHPADRESLP